MGVEMKKVLILWLALVCVTVASAAQAEDQPQSGILDVYVGFVGIDDRSYQVVILNNDDVGNPPMPNYCGIGFRHGLIKLNYKRPDGVIVDLPGCWVQKGTKSDSKLIFRYYSLDTANPGVHAFSAPMGAFYPAKWEWRKGTITDIRFE